MAVPRVVDPQGNEWTVRRRWVHRRLRWRGPGRDALAALDGADLVGAGADLPVVGIVLLVIALIIFAIVAVLFVIPALIFLVELLIVLVIVTVGLAGRMLFGRPWTVEARPTSGGSALEWQTTGWRASRSLVRSVADQLRSVGPPAGGTPVAPDSTRPASPAPGSGGR